MSSDNEEHPPVAPLSEIHGCVKWFNNKQGYGFINVTSGVNTGSDVFVHHSAIQVGTDQYKYLVSRLQEVEI